MRVLDSGLLFWATLYILHVRYSASSLACKTRQLTGQVMVNCRICDESL